MLVHGWRHFPSAAKCFIYICTYYVLSCSDLWYGILTAFYRLRYTVIRVLILSYRFRHCRVIYDCIYRDTRLHNSCSIRLTVYCVTTFPIVFYQCINVCHTGYLMNKQRVLWASFIPFPVYPFLRAGSCRIYYQRTPGTEISTAGGHFPANFPRHLYFWTVQYRRLELQKHTCTGVR